MWLRDAVVSNKLPTVRDLGNARFFPYRFGHAFWAYVAGRWDDSTVMLLFNTAVKAGDAEQAIRIVLGMDGEQFSAQWHESIRKVYAGFLERQSPPSAFGRVIIDKSRGGGELNIAPALSPDGRRVAYMSERDLFSVDLYLADVDTGKVLHKLSSTATDPHFDSLQFIESAGSWSPDGRLFVQNAVVRGQGALLVFDTEKGRRIKEVVFKEFSELRNPVMAPDGRRVAFAALAGGLLDLWLYDMESGEKSRLTSDAFADLHPAFSPDGRQLAFITDRFSTTLDTLTFGDCRLAIYDFADKSIREVAGHPRGMQTNPQWAPDGRTLYFVSTVNGSPDVHRVDLATGELRQVTALQTGVAGITPLSPSISVAQRTGRLAFAARQGGGYAIYAADDAGVLAGEPPREPLLNAATVSLPPAATTPREPDRQLANSTRGLPRAALPDSKPYKAKLGLDFVGQPTIGVGVNQFGAYAGGSTSLFFSDMLGNHNLGVVAQINGGIQDIAGLVQYANLSKRFDWAVGVQHIPYITGGTFNRYRDTVDGLPVIVDDFLLERQTSTGTVAIGSLPFNRARRLEVQAGYRRIGFSLQRRKQVLPRGRQFPRRREGRPRPSLRAAPPVFDRCSARARHVAVRSDQPHHREPRAAGGFAVVRHHPVHERAGGRACLLHAGAAAHVRLPRDARRPLRHRVGGRAVPVVVHRIPGSHPRLRRHQRRRLQRDRAAGVRLPVVRPPVRQPHGRGQRRTARAACGAVQREARVRARPGGGGAVRGRRRRLDQRRQGGLPRGRPRVGAKRGRGGPRERVRDHGGRNGIRAAVRSLEQRLGVELELHPGLLIRPRVREPGANDLNRSELRGQNPITRSTL